MVRFRLQQEPCYFALATPTPSPDPVTGAVEVHYGTNVNPTAVLLLVGLGQLPVSPSAAATAMPVFGGLFANNQCYPEYYPGVFALAAASIILIGVHPRRDPRDPDARNDVAGGQA